MEETLISLETSKLAKRKGFNEKTFHYYKLDFGKWSKADGIPKRFLTPLEDSENIFQKCKISEKGQPHLGPAPTQAFLQEWIFENHFIHISILLNAKVFSYTLYDYKSNMYLTRVVGEFPTNKSALEDALLTCLKMI